MKTTSIMPLLLSGLLLNIDCYALDIEILKEQCDEIGFKIHTADNGKCVLRLMESAAIQKIKEDEELEQIKQKSK